VYVSEYFRLAMRSLKTNVMRTLLTMLGIVIGVAVTILVVAIGQGATKSVSDQIDAMGTNLLMVRQGPRRVQLTAAGRNAPTQTQNNLTLLDATMIGKLFPQTVQAVAPQVRGNVQVRLNGVDALTTVIGTTPEYESVNNATTRAGRFFTSFEDQGNRRVCLVGNSVAEKLTGNANADLTGISLSVNNADFTIVGMLSPKGTGSFGQDQDDVVLIPITPAMQRVLGDVNLNMISISCVSPDMMALAQQQIAALLRQRHHLSPPFPQNDDFQVTNQTDLLARSESVTTTMTSLLTAVAIISLVVGGIGIMNIMLVSVTERTREIGIRKAIGATPHDILMQFLVEASIISVLGGFVGVALGVTSSMLLASFGGWNTIVSTTALCIALVVSAGVGIFFGIYPARKAAGLNPIEALRYE
jgi:putative ABC transport system permease protein